MKRILPCLFLMLSTGAFAAAPDAPQESNELPTPVFQKLKNLFDQIYGAQVGLMADGPGVDRAQIEKVLREEAAKDKDALLKALGAERPAHREMAARALEYCGDKAAAVAESLVKVVADDKDESVRRAAAVALDRKLPGCGGGRKFAQGGGRRFGCRARRGGDGAGEHQG